MFEPAAAADAMDTRHRAAEYPQVLFRLEIRCVAALPRKQCEAIALVHQQRLARVHLQRRDARQFRIGEFRDECVLFEDRGVAQSFGAIELGDDLAAVVEPDLVDAVFIAVEREQVAVATKSKSLDRGENQIRRQIGVRGGVGLTHDGYDLR